MLDYMKRRTGAALITLRRKAIEALQDAQDLPLRPDIADPEHQHVVQVERWGQTLWECRAGQARQPVGCDRHAKHHFCTTCQGYYGVSHTGIHRGANKHPTWGISGCACLPCRRERARRASLA